MTSSCLSIQGQAGDASAPTLINMEEQQRQLLVLLLHAYICREREKQRTDVPPCKVPLCGTFKTILTHIAGPCTEGKNCRGKGKLLRRGSFMAQYSFVKILTLETPYSVMQWQNRHKRHPIARPLGRAMRRHLWVQTLIYILTQPRQWCEAISCYIAL